MTNQQLPTHKCRNKVYRRGVVSRCGRLSMESTCKECKTALSETRNRLLGLQETLSEAEVEEVPCAVDQRIKPAAKKPSIQHAKPIVRIGSTPKGEPKEFIDRLEDALFEGKKKEPSNKPDDDEFDTEFKTHCDDDSCDNHEPKDSHNRSSSLTDGPDGAKQTGSAYLK